ncbi:MAG TPA: class I SAM-dependent methyltransferase [Acidimicrobiales bacterium]|nr:class I SAM-dependent methyltransferase [Acidimicrobiales bacterium]
MPGWRAEPASSVPPGATRAWSPSATGRPAPSSTFNQEAASCSPRSLNSPLCWWAAEGWPPNIPVAARRLRPRGAWVVAADDDRPALPFADASFDLVTSRHPVITWWGEIARVLRPGGGFLSQQVGPRSVAELTEFMMGPQTGPPARDPGLARSAAEAAGLTVTDLRLERLRTEFYDVGAVVYFLRLVVWIVPGFTVERYRDRLEALHQRIVEAGPFVAYASRFLIEATKPPPAS